MKIKSIKLKDFKRFTDLTVQNIPETAKLVVLVGPNGCGKSSLFEALNTWVVRNQGIDRNILLNYYWKKNNSVSLSGNSLSQSFYHEDKINIEFDNQNEAEQQATRSVYVRTAYRNQPLFSLKQLGKAISALVENRNKLMIDNEFAVEENYKRLVSNGINMLYNDKDAESKLVRELRKEIVENLNEHLQNLFEDLKFTSLGDPLVDGSFKFTKEGAEDFDYRNLSGGEKAAFDLILDLHIKSKEFNDTVFCIDEPEAHINTKLQAKLLEVLCDLIPNNCQLWIATHSIGMMKKAIELHKKSPKEIVFLDFGDKDFDEVVKIEPIKPTRTFWENVLKIALDDMSDLITPSRIVFCEGKAKEETGDGFDADIYNEIFSEELPDTKFISLGGKSEIKKHKRKFISVLEIISEKMTIQTLRDRDNLTNSRVEEIKEKGDLVLKRKTIESYLLDEEVLIKLCEKHGVLTKAEILIGELKKITDNNGDDMKQAIKDLYPKIQSILEIGNLGENWKDFLTNEIAPLITSDMDIYQELKEVIF